MNSHPTRADDERLLKMLRLRRSLLSADVAVHCQSKKDAVRVMTNRVLEADILASGEWEDDIRAAYGFVHGCWRP